MMIMMMNQLLPEEQNQNRLINNVVLSRYRQVQKQIVIGCMKILMTNTEIIFVDVYKIIF